jgi:two-component system response regulator
VKQTQTRHTILFVDDNPADVGLAREAATACRSEFDLQVIVSADAALARLVGSKERAPLLVVLNLKLPKLDGLAVIRSLRLNRATHDIPVLVYSTEFTRADVLMSYQAGANSFVVKPLDAQQFTDFFSRQLAYWLTAKHFHSRSENALT